MAYKKIAVFASGSGTNAENIGRFFMHSDVAKVTLILSNKKDSGVHLRAAAVNIPSVSFSREDFYENGTVLQTLRDSGTDFIVLAGFLWLVPADLINAFPGRIINIHPALLPRYGGKGMYGMNVHRAVIENGNVSRGSPSTM